MTRSVPLLTLLTVSLPAFLLWGNTDPPTPPASMPWAIEVYREYCPELTDEAHIEDCWTGYDEEELHLVVVTDMPTLVPAERDTIEILTVAPPSTPPAPLTALPQAVKVYRASCPGLVAEVYVEDCWTGYVDEELHLVVVTDSPDLIPSEVDSIPTLTMPPPSDPPTEDDADNSEANSQGTGAASSGASGQGNAKSSSSGTQQSGKSTKSTEGSSAETQQNPPIAGIPYATAAEIFSRQPFNALDGVWDVRLEADGIVVRTTQPALVPATFEGLPVRTELISIRTRDVFAIDLRGAR